MMTPIVHIPIRQLRIKQHGIPRLGLDAQSLSRLGIDPSWELRRASLHPLVQIQQQGGKARGLILAAEVGVPEIVVGGVLLSDVVVHQLERLGEAVGRAHVRVLLGRSRTEERLVDPQYVGGAAVDGVDDGVLLAVDPGVEGGARVGGGVADGVPYGVAGRSGTMEFHAGGEVHDVFDFDGGEEIVDFEGAWGARKHLHRHIQHLLLAPILAQQPLLPLLQNPIPSLRLHTPQLVLGRMTRKMHLRRGHPMLLPEVIRPPYLVRRTVPGIQRQILPSREFKVLLPENLTANVILIRLKFLRRQRVEIVLRRLLVALHGNAIVIIHGRGRAHHPPRQNDRFVTRQRQIERVSRKARRSRAIERGHDAHGTSRSAVLRIPVETHRLGADVDEFGGPSVVLGTLRGARAGRFLVECGDVRLDVRAEFLGTVP
mmetsp:Transcript_18733/g.39414  ORF Transcript_18733/g.39414 Transcript_18733/m.39414 type:complete len:429 (-) Transcript_18733:34-1320(-)